MNKKEQFGRVAEMENTDPFVSLFLVLQSPTIIRTTSDVEVNIFMRIGPGDIQHGNKIIPIII
ncbi:MAG: hypothetical protein C5B47_00620 [Verrucomicrobia bacterium]|nr:MAG: hypothetical protein C5B47_00620 [Verrucomicrobiota bacterium]